MTYDLSILFVDKVLNLNRYIKVQWYCLYISSMPSYKRKINFIHFQFNFHYAIHF